ncbi:MAG TPA: pyridoxamine 5'-phosphate oxidase family protein [Actinomycetota bacterium]|nr:pyridoxamine 5'-phosphate oxidase family protein [Actinomycetota bacterium]
MPTRSEVLFPDRPEYGAMTASDTPVPPLTWNVVRSWLEASRYFWVVTCRPDGRPHARPVWGIWLEPRFYFTTSPDTLMARNIAAAGHGAVHPESAVDVVIIEGPIRGAGGRVPAEARAAYESKYGVRTDPRDRGMPFYLLETERAIAWNARDPRASAARWTFRG